MMMKEELLKGLKFEDRELQDIFIMNRIGSLIQEGQEINKILEIATSTRNIVENDYNLLLNRREKVIEEITTLSTLMFDMDKSTSIVLEDILNGLKKDIKMKENDLLGDLLSALDKLSKFDEKIEKVNEKPQHIDELNIPKDIKEILRKEMLEKGIDVDKCGIVVERRKISK